MAALACWLGAQSALAERLEDCSVIVTTRVIMGSNRGNVNWKGSFGPAVEASLKLFPFTSYDLVQQEARRVSFDRREAFPVPGHRHLLVQPTAFDNGRVSLDVRLMQGQKVLVDTALKLKNGGEFVVAGPKHDDGTLFVAIGALVPAKRVRPKSGRIQNEGLLLQPVGR